MDREVREEGKGEERDGGAALPVIKSMIFGRADCGQVDLNVCFFFFFFFFFFFSFSGVS